MAAADSCRTARLIRRVEMIGTGVPYHFNSSWGPFLSGK